MGTYTGVRFKATLNELGVKVATALSNKPWPDWIDVVQDHPELVIPRWLGTGRRIFIPRGHTSCIGCRDDWDDDGFFRVENGIWDVECALKNYEDEIDTFLDEVLPQLISEPCKVEIQFEYDDGPRFESVEPV